jgi:thiamine-phosphate pyrophosphorylase
MLQLRSRVYPIVDTATLAARGFDAATFAAALIDGGAQWLQFRHKTLFTRDVFAQLDAIAALCQRAGVQLIVDDRADVAALFGAGLHLGQDDLPPALARRLPLAGPVGFSTHNAAQLEAAAAEPVDYVALGPIFLTASKHNPDPAVGLEHLRAWRALSARALVAIGGITRATAQAVLRAGADSIAVIGDLLPEEITKATVRERTEEWIRLTQ